MNKSTLGLLAVFVLLAGVLAHSSSDAFAISNKNVTSSTQKKITDDKIKMSEKRQADTSKKTNEKSVGKTLKSVKHRATTVKREKLAAGIKH